MKKLKPKTPVNKKSFSTATLWVGGSEFKMFCLFTAIYRSGAVRELAFVRMPYSNRPKKGGTKSVPYGLMNPATYGETRARVKLALTKKQVPQNPKAYNPPMHRGP